MLRVGILSPERPPKKDARCIDRSRPLSLSTTSSLDTISLSTLHRHVAPVRPETFSRGDNLSEHFREFAQIVRAFCSPFRHRAGFRAANRLNYIHVEHSRLHVSGNFWDASNNKWTGLKLKLLAHTNILPTVGTSSRCTHAERASRLAHFLPLPYPPVEHHRRCRDS